MTIRTTICALFAITASGILLEVTAGADEGMWTFDNPPAKLLEQRYGFTLTQSWLDHIRLSCVRLNDGGSGSFVSPHGLLLTNHHVARGQIQKNSTRDYDYIRDGFYATTGALEMKSPDLEVNVLVSMEDITDRVTAVYQTNDTPAQQSVRREGVIAAMERDNAAKSGLRCDVVTLYHGAEYWLYRYKKYTDVRLVFAPEEQAAFFGGGPDNFTYPRHDLDIAFFRVYENGRPIDSKDYLRWNQHGAKDEELVFVAGHPDRTARLSTLAQLELERDLIQPSAVKILMHRLAVLTKYSERGAEPARQSRTEIFNLENRLKVYEGRLRGLLDGNVMDKKRREEELIRAAVRANPEWQAAYGSAWDELAEAERKAASRMKEGWYRSLDSDLMRLADMIVLYASEIEKPDSGRLNGFHEAQLESLRYQMFSPAPIYPDLEIARITGQLELALEELGPEDPFVKIVLIGRSPKEAAKALVDGSRLFTPEGRRKLVRGGIAAVANSDDSMIELARGIAPRRRELIEWTENNIHSVEQRASTQIAQALFTANGKSTYPDATSTLRLSFGQVKGYSTNGTQAPSRTTFYGLYDRAESFNFSPPWSLSRRYKEGRGRLDLATTLDFVTTNDVIGGSSGAPVVNRNGDIVGVIFDGNIESLVGNFVYEGERSRAVAVHTAAITEVLRKLYDAPALLKELVME